MSDISKAIILHNVPSNWDSHEISEWISPAGEVSKIVNQDGKILIIFNDPESVENSQLLNGNEGISIVVPTETEFEEFCPKSESKSSGETHHQAETKQETEKEPPKKDEPHKRSCDSHNKDEDGYDFLIKEKLEKSPQKASPEKEKVSDEDPKPKQMPYEEASRNEEKPETENFPRETSYEKLTEQDVNAWKDMRCDLQTGTCYKVSTAEALEKKNLPIGKQIPKNSNLELIFSSKFIGKVFTAWIVYYFLSQTIIS